MNESNKASYQKDQKIKKINNKEVLILKFKEKIQGHNKIT